MTDNECFNHNLDTLGVTDIAKRVELKLARSEDDLIAMLPEGAYLMTAKLGNCFGYTKEDMVFLDEDSGMNYLVLTHEIAHMKTPGDGHGPKFMQEWRRLANG